MKVTGSSQHGFMNGKSCQTKLIGFYDGMTGLVDEPKTVDIVYLNFEMGNGVKSLTILIDN